MDHFVVTGARPYDGRYEFELEFAAFTTLEWGWIKRHAGYLPGTILDGFRGADAELFTVFVVVAMHRNGTIREQDVPDVFEKLRRLPFEDTITLETGDTEEDDAGPPDARQSSNGSTFGTGSKTSSESPDSDPTGTGHPPSATSASVPATSVG